jgi:hypothetical protein
MHEKRNRRIQRKEYNNGDIRHTRPAEYMRRDMRGLNTCYKN